MTRALLVLLLLCAMAMPARAANPRLIIDSSQRAVDIQSGFTGTNLLIFGAILYPGGKVPDKAPDLAIVVEGPLQSITVRAKEKLGGVIWVNAERSDFRSVPSYYGVASSRPLSELIDSKTADIYQLGLDHIYFSPTGRVEASRLGRFQDGLVEMKARKGLYLQRAGGVEISQKILYRVRMPLPADVPVGRYRASAYLIDKGRVLTVEETDIIVDKTGFERWVTNFARHYSLAYGLTAVLISLLLGWAAGTFMRRG